MTAPTGSSAAISKRMALSPARLPRSVITAFVALLVLSMFAILPMATAPVAAQGSQIVFSEILAKNTGDVTGILDEDGDSPDWIELANTGSTAYSLDDHVLVDGGAMWPFPSGVQIPAGGELLVWASGKDRSGSQLHTNFSLTLDGEYLALVDGANALVAALAPEYPAQTANVSWGITANGTTGFMTSLTPGAPNSSSGAAPVGPPEAAIGRGFFTTAVTETLTVPAGAVVRYTLDGSVPTASSTAYTAPITINPSPTGLATLRARSFGAGGSESADVSWSYVFPDSLYTGLAGDGLESLPAIILNTDDGVYPVETDKSRSMIEMVELPGGNEGFSVTAGVKEFGESSVTFRKSNMRLFFDSDFGPTELDYPVFDGYGQGIVEPATKFDKLELRGGSWDSWQAAAGGRFNPSDYYLTDRYIRDIRLDMGGVQTHGRFVNVWINGDYRGFYQLRERFDHAFFGSYADESRSSIESIKINDGDYSNNGDQNVNGDGSVFAGLTGNFQVDKSWIDEEALVDYTLVMSLAEYDFEKEHRGAGSMNEDSPNDYIFIHNDNDFRLRPVSRVLTGPIGFSPGFFVPALVPFLDDYRNDPEFASIARSRVENALCDNGAMTVNKMLERLDYWEDEIELAMRSEDVRWDGFASTNYSGTNNVVDKYGSWASNMSSIRGRIPSLMPDLYSAWQAEGFYDGCNNRIPTFEIDPQVDGVGQQVSVAVNGFDPDLDAITWGASGLPSGLVIDPTTGIVAGSPTATGTYAATIQASDSAGATAVRRVDWKVVNGSGVGGEIVINEIMYNPAIESLPFAFDPDLAAYIELFNNGTVDADLSGVSLVGVGLDSIPAGTIIAPGEFAVVAQNATAFERTYGFAPDFVFPGGLSNNGETISVVDQFGEVIDSVPFGIEAPWPADTDGLGPSLELANVATDNALPSSWVTSRPGGTPGEPNRSTGDVDCDGSTTLADALLVLQFSVGNRIDGGTCPVPVASAINASAGDVSADGQLTVLDATAIAQCVSLIPNPYCED